MNLFELFVKIGVDDQASDKISNLSSKLGNGLKTAAKVGAAAVGAASTAIVALGKIGLEYNSQMEQYTTNFTTMLGSQEAAVKKVEELKKFAASTPLSMDDLAKGTQTLLAFGVESENSTSILRQLGDIALGNADKMQRLSTAFGKATASGKLSGEVVQQMIDAGWNPLIQISQTAGETMEETQKRMSAGKISVEELQAAMEAVTSGTGQFAGGMEAASHTTQGLISTLQDNARALVGEVFQPISDGLLSEVLPGAIEAISGLTTAFRENGISGMIDASGKIVGSALGTIASALPDFINTAIEIIKSISKGIFDNLPTIVDAAVKIVTTMGKSIFDNLDKVIEFGQKMLNSLLSGISNNASKISGPVTEIITKFGNFILENLPEIIMAGIDILVALAKGIVESIPELATAATKAIIELAAYLISAENLEKIISLGADLIDALSEGIGNVIDTLSSVGSDVVESIKSGISSAWDGLVSWFNGIWDSLFGKRSVNVKANVSTNGSHAGGLAYVPFDGYIAELHKGERVLTASEAKSYKDDEKSGVGGVTVIQNIYSQAKTAADLMLEARHQQERAVLLGV